ncbi:MAG: RluA family pseudouridine synthase, partial [Phycisphaerales bacterium]|nr:RluA family pseudouridine synthase [Phycisphaerales bacterium]
MTAGTSPSQQPGDHSAIPHAAPETPPPPDSLLTPGGKVDHDALIRLVEHRRATGADEGPPPTVRFDLQRDIKDRLDRYLTSRVPFLSRTRLQRLIESGGATVNARPAKPSTRLRLGDTVELVIPLPEGTSIRPEPIDLDVLYEDEHLIVLNKRPAIIVHPARSENSGTMINALAWRLQHQTGGALSTVGEEFARPGVVHRLDRDTTGCIVFAKQDEAHWKLGAQFEHRRVEKRYLALVHGPFEPLVDVIDLPIGPHPSREKGYREKHVVRHDEFGKASLTIARVVERYRLHDRPVGDQAFSLLELELKTGRTHQIRVH